MKKLLFTLMFVLLLSTYCHADKIGDNLSVEGNLSTSGSVIIENDLTVNDDADFDDDVNIDGILEVGDDMTIDGTLSVSEGIFKYLGTTVKLYDFDPPAINTWYNLTSSSFIGTGRKLCLLRVRSDSDASAYGIFRPDGEAADFTWDDGAGANTGLAGNTTGDCTYAMCSTGTNGDLEFSAAVANPTEIYLEGYIE